MILFIMDKANNGLSRDVVITNKLGLHARAAAKISKCAQNSKSNVWIIKDGAEADASSIIDILTLACVRGTQITIKIDDRSDLEILNNLTKLVESGFGE
ncbi:MAG: HPr family phosphocarrier protein [Proteobacteria bacterium]|nr:HPr family phosphocarrier protein [Pseudomonadota bacterium]